MRTILSSQSHQDTLNVYHQCRDLFDEVCAIHNEKYISHATGNAKEDAFTLHQHLDPALKHLDREKTAYVGDRILFRKPTTSPEDSEYFYLRSCWIFATLSAMTVKERQMITGQLIKEIAQKIFAKKQDDDSIPYGPHTAIVNRVVEAVEAIFFSKDFLPKQRAVLSYEREIMRGAGKGSIQAITSRHLLQGYLPFSLGLYHAVQENRNTMDSWLQQLQKEFDLDEDERQNLWTILKEQTPILFFDFLKNVDTPVVLQLGIKLEKEKKSRSFPQALRVYRVFQREIIDFQEIEYSTSLPRSNPWMRHLFIPLQEILGVSFTQETVSIEELFTALAQKIPTDPPLDSALFKKHKITTVDALATQLRTIYECQFHEPQKLEEVYQKCGLLADKTAGDPANHLDTKLQLLRNTVSTLTRTFRTLDDKNSLEKDMSGLKIN